MVVDSWLTIEIEDVKQGFTAKLDEMKEAVLKDFGMVQFVKAEDVCGEFGFVTEKMPEGVYEH